MLIVQTFDLFSIRWNICEQLFEYCSFGEIVDKLVPSLELFYV